MKKLSLRTQQLEESLDKMRAALTAGRLMTATEISMHLDCTVPAVHNYLRRLKRRGFVFQTEKVHDGVRGPLAKAYAIVGSPKKAKRASA